MYFMLETFLLSFLIKPMPQISFFAGFLFTGGLWLFISSHTQNVGGGIFAIWKNVTHTILGSVPSIQLSLGVPYCSSLTSVESHHSKPVIFKCFQHMAY